MADYDYVYIATLVKKAQNGDSQAFSELYTISCQKV